jgi:hypothetical protein
LQSDNVVLGALALSLMIDDLVEPHSAVLDNDEYVSGWHGHFVHAPDVEDDIN